MSKKLTLESLGTFSDEEATVIAREISHVDRGLGIQATTSNLRVDSGPTVWWHVNVHPKQATAARAWLKGWRAGVDAGRIGMRAALQGESIAEATWKVTGRRDESDLASESSEGIYRVRWYRDGRCVVSSQVNGALLGVYAAGQWDDGDRIPDHVRAFCLNVQPGERIRCDQCAMATVNGVATHPVEGDDNQE